ncbi:pentatricopeptide repeat-containing protein At4g04370 [Selaginella moellendorffii]|nr:pentatricopeptide repeat-containing protein At4g04370 [Selaginella moellendorffii]|eukprot:XP_002978986.2 pentatricopeptide repeat-containing protein At4g04370 [Selaginella moellendorffii]
MKSYSSPSGQRQVTGGTLLPRLSGIEMQDLDLQCSQDGDHHHQQQQQQRQRQRKEEEDFVSVGCSGRLRSIFTRKGVFQEKHSSDGWCSRLVRRLFGGASTSSTSPSNSGEEQRSSSQYRRLPSELFAKVRGNTVWKDRFERLTSFAKHEHDDDRGKESSGVTPLWERRMLAPIPSSDDVHRCGLVSSYTGLTPGIAQHSHENVRGTSKEWAMTSERLKSSLVGDLDAQGFASLLRECARSRDFAEGSLVHQRIIASSRHRHDRFLQNLVVRMYGECGRVDEAAKVFHSIARKNLFSWSSMIAAFAQNGHSTAAVELYSDMIQRSGLRPDSVVFVALLGALDSLQSIREIHAEIISAGIHGETIVGTAIVNAYGRLGSVEESLSAFHSILAKDVIAWNSIVAVLSQHGELDRALELYRKMDESAVPPDRITLASLLDGCGGDRPRELEIGRFIDKESVRKALRGDPAIDNALIRMYGRCRRVEEARAVFATMGLRNLASWNAIIAANAQNGCFTEAIEALESMIQLKSVTPDRMSFSVLLDSCCGSEHLAHGVKIHGLIFLCAIDSDLFLDNALITMYGRCGSVERAQKVFAAMEERDLVSWTAMIAANAANGHFLASVLLYLRMIQEGVLPDRITYATLLAGCLKQRAIDPGRMIHAHIESFYGRNMDRDNVLGSHLVNLYRRCGSLEEAKSVFDRLGDPDASCWSAMIASYAQSGYGSQALELFQRMDRRGIVPDRLAFLSILSVCSSIDLGRRFHSRIAGMDRENSIATALIQMYGRLGFVEESKGVFDRLEKEQGDGDDRDVAVWTSLIQAYARNNRPREALEIFAAMMDHRCEPDAASFASAMDACSSLGDLTLARKIHAQIISLSSNPREEIQILATNAAIAMYGKCKSLEEAKTAFDRAIHAKNTVNTATWNAMIGAYAQNGHPGAGLELYQQMKSQGIQPDRATLVIALDAAAMIEEFELGRDVLIDGALEYDERVATAVIGMLARSGKTIRAKRVFDSIPRRDGICWSAMVTAYAQNGHSILALELFSEMVVEGFVADKAAIVSILAACSQSGDFRRGRSYFASMQADFSVDPIAEHYACVVDLFSRIGWIREAQELAREMPFKADRAAAMALLAGGRTGGVRSFRGDDLGASLDCAAPYVLLSNIYKQSEL